MRCGYSSGPTTPCCKSATVTRPPALNPSTSGSRAKPSEFNVIPIFSPRDDGGGCAEPARRVWRAETRDRSARTPFRVRVDGCAIGGSRSAQDVGVGSGEHRLQPLESAGDVHSPWCKSTAKAQLGAPLESEWRRHGLSGDPHERY